LKTKFTNKESDDLDHNVLLFGMKMQLKEEVAINEIEPTKVFNNAINETWISGVDGDNDKDEEDDNLNNVHHKCEEKDKKAFQCKKNNAEGEKREPFCGKGNRCENHGHEKRDKLVEPENRNRSPVDYREMNEDSAAMIDIPIVHIEVEETVLIRMTTQDGTSIRTTMTA